MKEAHSPLSPKLSDSPGGSVAETHEAADNESLGKEAAQNAQSDAEPEAEPIYTMDPTGSKVDMDDALAKARAIAAKLGSMQRSSAAAATATATAAKPPMERRRSVSPDRSQPAKRSRSPSPLPPQRRDNRRRFDADVQMRPLLSFPVPSQLSGLIIGRNGNHLRSLEQRHGVRIQFDNADRRSVERQITIEGPVDSAESARRDILDFVARQDGPKPTKQQAMPAAAPPSRVVPGGGESSVMVPNGKVGLIIGRGGESIRDIQYSSGANVQVQPDSGQRDREIRLIGSPDQIEHARMRIMEIVSAEEPHRNPVQPAAHSRPQQFVEEFQIPADSVAIVIGRGGETIKFLQQSSGCRIQVLQGPQFSGPFRPVTISGEQQACLQARRMIEEKIDSAQERQRQGQFPSAGGYGQMGGPRGSANVQKPYNQSNMGYGGYGRSSDSRQWNQQQPQQQYYSPQQSYDTAQYGSYSGYQQQQQQPAAEQTQWTNQQAADYYSQYAASNPEYAQYADYYRKLAEKDPNGIVPSGN
ncbi:hypothetical protein IWW36_000765 [Coemansia brasiliensis]|uniref:K Homology domain-containing protein n=1 Tax=Coemansia brasiliensis TaxID=2650707 RepID=A0A9W8IIY3_9FUNG|nr:hypothetical protein IWW36_000765 [Coemansia brasiliensis]